MRPLLFALVVLSVTTPALAASRGGGNAIANDTTTSMGEPLDSPSFTAPRSAAIAGTPANRRALELPLRDFHPEARLPRAPALSPMARSHFRPADLSVTPGHDGQKPSVGRRNRAGSDSISVASAEIRACTKGVGALSAAPTQQRTCLWPSGVTQRRQAFWQLA